jgi:hypothetical protein
MRRSSRCGFTLVELLAVILVAIIAAVVLIVPAATVGRRTGCGNRQLKDSTQVRGLHQALISWAQNNGDRFPLPSVADADNTTVAELGPAKDHTANILSMLVFNGAISTEILINPAEANPGIQLKDDYEYERPKAAVHPAKALWDPSLGADFTSPKGGHNSYAHMLPSGRRLPLWANSTLNAERVVIGNRGPEIASTRQRSDGAVTPVLANPKSYTLLMHGSRTTWEGNAAFEDNHVEFLTSLRAGTYTSSTGVKRDDIISYDEPDDPTGTNNFLGIFTTAGPTPSSFKAIWD